MPSNHYIESSLYQLHEKNVSEINIANADGSNLEIARRKIVRRTLALSAVRPCLFPGRWKKQRRQQCPYLQNAKMTNQRIATIAAKEHKSAVFCTWRRFCISVEYFGAIALPNLEESRTMPQIDYDISYCLASLNGRNDLFDRFMWMLSANSLLKGGVLAAFLWYAWFAEMGRTDRVRSQALSGEAIVRQQPAVPLARWHDH
jgi:hypothetical protein